MKTKRLAGLASAALIALFAGHAGAAPVVGTIPGKDQANNFITKFFDAKTVVEGWYGAQVSLTQASTVTLEYFGAEAGFTNTFTLGGCSFRHTGGSGGGTGTFTNDSSSGLGSGDTVLDNSSTPKKSCTTGELGAGLLSFQFLSVDNNGVNKASVSNATNNDNSGLLANFFVSFDTTGNYGLDTTKNNSTPGGGQSLWLFYDDGGARNDDNHDDMVIRMTINQGGGGFPSFTVPEPSALALVGLALVGLGLSRRRASRA